MKCIAMKLFAILLIFFNVDQCCAEGFAAGTLIKIPDGYAKIENVRIDDHVLCYDVEKNIVESSVAHIAKKSIDCYVRITIAGECLCVAGEQRLYDENNDVWLLAKSLKNGDVLAGHIIVVECANEPIDLYLITVAQHHNFFVTTLDICAHNFFPPILVAISAAFGVSGIEIASISAGLAGLGGFFGYQWHKKNKQNKFVIERMTFDITQESDDIYSLNDAQAPGMPTEKDGYYPPKKWDGKKKAHPINGKIGWPDKKGKIWVPSGPKGHGGPHWDVQYLNGIDYDNVYPGGKIRAGR